METTIGQTLNSILRNTDSKENATNEILSEHIEYLISVFRWACMEVCPNFTPHKKELMNDIYRYLNGWRGNLDPEKGLWLYGPPGTGKSTIMQICQKYQQQVWFNRKTWRSEKGFVIHPASFVVGRYSKNGIEGLNQYVERSDFGFDELGKEPNPGNHFGTKMDVMQYIIQIRYDFRRHCKTYVTTNLYPDQITGVYGNYIADRVKEMFNVVHITGESLRK